MFTLCIRTSLSDWRTVFLTRVSTSESFCKRYFCHIYSLEQPPSFLAKTVLLVFLGVKKYHVKIQILCYARKTLSCKSILQLGLKYYCLFEKYCNLTGAIARTFLGKTNDYFQSQKVFNLANYLSKKCY